MKSWTDIPALSLLSNQWSPAVQNQLVHLFCVHIALFVLGRPGRSSWGCPIDDVRKLCAVFPPAKLSLWYHHTWISTGREFRQQQYCRLCPRTATCITNSTAGPSSQYLSYCHRLASNSLWLSAWCTMSADLLWHSTACWHWGHRLRTYCLDTPRLRTWYGLVLSTSTVSGVVLLWSDVYLHYFHVEKVGENRGWTEKQCNGKDSG